MREKILQFARGDFSSSRSRLILSENQIVLEVDEGRTSGGSLYIGNESGVRMKGLIISDCRYLEVSENQFSGKEATINYTFHAEELYAGETIKTELVIISSCGEVKVPIDVTIVLPAIKYSGGKINDLMDFAEASMRYPNEALDIFLSDDFKRVLLYRDIRNQAVYDALIESTDKMHALEEFLVAARKIRRDSLHETNMAESPYDDIDNTDGRTDDGYEFVRLLIDEYVDFRCKKITAKQFSDKVDGMVISLRGKCDEAYLKMCQSFAALASERYDVAARFSDDLGGIHKPYSGAPMEEVVEYAYRLYLEAMTSAPEEMTENAVRAAKEIRYYYENGYDHYLLPWFLMKFETRYTNSRTAYAELLSLIREGCESPLIYYEFCAVIKSNPDLMHDWDEVMIQPLAWGIDRHLFDTRMAMVYTYHVSRVREFNEVLIESLETLYEDFQLEDVLSTLCKFIIRNEKSSEKYLKWLELGIKKQLAITRIYESYMESLPDNSVTIIPHQVMLYFMYDNNLAIREKELLFASAIRDKDNNPSIYKAYSVMISNFARKRLEEGKINDALAVLYEDTIKISSVDETIAQCLPEVMFKYKIQCANPDMVGVCVVHKELKKEQYAAFKNNEAYVDLYSDNAIILLVDKNGNRYTGHEYYTVKKMLRLDNYAEHCFEVSKENDKLIAYMFIKIVNDYHVSPNMTDIREYARIKLDLSDYYEKKNLVALIQYYYENAEGEYLDDILEDIDIRKTDKNTKPVCIDLFIIRRMYEKAYDAVKEFGTEGLNEKYIIRLFDEYITRIGIDTYDETILSIAYSIYDRGKYTDDIIKYLAIHYTGESDRMYSIWKSAEGFNINKNSIEERILSQLLFTENNVLRGMKMLESYLYRENTDSDIKRGYTAYLSYLYLIEDADMTDLIWQWIRDNYLTEYNDVCSLAMIKKYSLKDELSVEEKIFCESRIDRLAHKGIVMPFYTRFTGFRSKRYVMCISRPGQEIGIRYKVNETVYNDVLNEVFYGIYVRELVVFMDEKLVYEFYVEKNGKKVLLGQGQLEYEEDSTGEISRYKMINKMIGHYIDEDVDSLYSCMETYVKLEEASHSLFETL